MLNENQLKFPSFALGHFDPVRDGIFVALYKLILSGILRAKFLNDIYNLNTNCVSTFTFL